MLISLPLALRPEGPISPDGPISPRAPNALEPKLVPYGYAMATAKMQKISINAYKNDKNLSIMI